MAEHELNKIVDNAGEVFNLRDSSKLGKTGDASNTTSTFTKESGDTSSITSGSKLSAIFTAISSFFASLKSLAFKDKVTDSDISGTISDSHIASASTWNGKYTKPSTGIPKTDLASAVQTSLGKADSALQSHQDISGKADKVRGATAGNFAGLDSNGNLVDSGKSYSDLEDVFTKVEASSTNGNIKINGTETTVYTHPTTAGNKHIPSGGSSGQFLGYDSSGTAKWVSITNTDTKQRIVASDSKTYLTGVTTAPTSSNQDLTGVANANVYATAGQLHATTFDVNGKCTLQFNTTTNALDFVFV